VQPSLSPSCDNNLNGDIHYEGVWELLYADLNRTNNCPQGRWGHTLAVYRNKLILYGGLSTNNEALDDIWMIDLDKIGTGTI